MSEKNSSTVAKWPVYSLFVSLPESSTNHIRRSQEGAQLVQGCRAYFSISRLRFN